MAQLIAFWLEKEWGKEHLQAWCQANKALFGNFPYKQLEQKETVKGQRKSPSDFVCPHISALSGKKLPLPLFRQMPMVLGHQDNLLISPKWSHPIARASSPIISKIHSASTTSHYRKWKTWVNEERSGQRYSVRLTFAVAEGHYLSMIPPRRMARFQSFRVDLPARWTKCFGLMSWSLN